MAGCGIAVGKKVDRLRPFCQAADWDWAASGHLRPLITEKGTHQSTSLHRDYPFEVNLSSARKDEIKAAVEELFGVQVAKVRTQNRQGKTRRYRFRGGGSPLEKGHRRPQTG